MLSEAKHLRSEGAGEISCYEQDSCLSLPACPVRTAGERQTGRSRSK
ncbi:MAG: hypothetical protein IJR49_00955 [Treponema sp.]|nr:hypothetical protein [Treponema sp.]